MGVTLPNSLVNNTPHDAVPVMNNFVALRDAYNGHKHTGIGTDVSQIEAGGIANGAVIESKIADNAVTDIKIGNRTVDQTQIPTGNTGLLTQLFSWFANRIKAITGKTNWYDAPDITLSGLNTKFDPTTGHKHTGVAGDGPKIDPTTGLTYVPVNKDGDIMTGPLQFIDANTKLQKGTNNSAKVQTNYGYIEIGPQNASYCHIQTDIPDGFYFNNSNLSANGNKVWHTGDAPKSLATNGYQKLPSGLIIQWDDINVAVPSSGSYNVTFPIAFPTAVFFITGQVNSGYPWAMSSWSLTGFTFVNNDSVTRTPRFWIAIGY